MASNTENLNLLMKNPSTDGADTFNIQTMLNENWQKIDNNAGTVAQTLANILKPTTPPLIGLPPSTTPDGMFQALGNTGELHVWRKTVVTGTAKVELEPAVSGYIVSNSGSSHHQTIKYSSTINEKGNLSGTITTLTVSYNTSNSDLFVLKGKYFEAGTTEILSNLKSPGGVWYIPNDASIQYITGKPNTTGYPYYYTHVATKMQKVVYVPAGTTTTYPVSTNPNAYQEGDDAKPAGYTLGEVVTGTFRFSPATWKYAPSINVSDDGAVTLGTGGGTQESGSGYNLLKGKFVSCSSPTIGSGFTADVIYYIPADANIAYTSTTGTCTDRYQPVTGYAAIPAGTTIEYLGKLGDKARVQVVSYVGTGTYGKSNPNSLTFDFVPKVVMIRCDGDTKIFDAIYGMRDVTVVLSAGYYVIVEWSKKTLSWYSTNSASEQMNYAGDKYYAIAIG